MIMGGNIAAENISSRLKQTIWELVEGVSFQFKETSSKATRALSSKRNRRFVVGDGEMLQKDRYQRKNN